MANLSLGRLSGGHRAVGHRSLDFDRGLISLSDDLEVLVSRQVNDAESVWGLVTRTRRAAAPANPALRPHPSYLGWHREVCFKR
jgi:putative restriction endonuclease